MEALAGLAFPGRRIETWVTDDYGPTIVLSTTDRGQRWPFEGDDAAR